MSLDRLIDRVTSLRTGVVAGELRPHKPVVLLSLIVMVDAGRLSTDRVQYDAELYGIFRRLFAVVQSGDDRPNMLDPFWRLKSDGLLLPIPVNAAAELIANQASPPTIGDLCERTEGSRIDADLWAGLQEPAGRLALFDAIIGRYFAQHRDALQAILWEERRVSELERDLERDEDASRQELPDEDIRLRTQAFRRVVLRAYDSRCSACGARVIVDDLVLVEAAHLVPFAVSRDDDPRNGIALCRNHHWAMDHGLIAPTRRQLWAVSQRLDERIEGQRELLGLSGQRLLLPAQPRFSPKPESLAWREQRLA